MESLVIPIITISAGIYFLIRNIGLLRDEKKLAAYIQTSRRAKPWVERFGVDRAREISRKYLLPMGVVIAAILLSIGLWSLSVAVTG